VTEPEFERIYLEHFGAVHQYILKLCRDTRTADEITSDTFFKAMRAIDQFDGKCDVRSWLCQIAKNSYFSYLKEGKRTVTLDSVSEQADAGSELEERIGDAEASIRILKALHTMQEPYKEVFTLRVFGELSFKQIAEIFGKTENWACVTYHRAKSKIQTLMEEIK
jgi:RNA polymerase sigma-70 factor (ECF subfamily)